MPMLPPTSNPALAIDMPANRVDSDPEKFSIMPWLNLSQLPPKDLEAIYAYLMSRLPIENKVESHPKDTGGKT